MNRGHMRRGHEEQHKGREPHKRGGGEEQHRGREVRERRFLVPSSLVGSEPMESSVDTLRRYPIIEAHWDEPHACFMGGGRGLGSD